MSDDRSLRRNVRGFNRHFETVAYRCVVAGMQATCRSAELEKMHPQLIREYRHRTLRENHTVTFTDTEELLSLAGEFLLSSAEANASPN